MMFSMNLNLALDLKVEKDHPDANKQSKSEYAQSGGDQTYSYHTFIFPFRWENESKKGYSFKKFAKIFDKNDAWAPTGPQAQDKFDDDEDAINYYNKYQYFYPQVRSAIFGGDQDVVKNYSFLPKKVNNKAHYLITKNGRTFELLVNRIRLRIFNTGVALLIFECENHKASQSSFADVKAINDFGRRILIPFYSNDSNASLGSADELELKIDDRTFSKDDFLTSFSNARSQNGDTVKKEYLSPLSNIIKDVLSYTSSVKFISDKKEIQGKEKTIRIFPSLDDRMIVACIMMSNCQAKKLDKCAFFTDEEKAKTLYEFIFVDPEGGCTCQNADMRNELLRKHVYTRWTDYGSVYGITAQGLFFLRNDDSKGDNYHYLTLNFLTEYIDMLTLCIAQRASLVAFQRAIASASKAGVESTKKLTDIQNRFSTFEAQLCFSEISSQEQAIEMYDMMQDSFLIKREMENVKAQIEGLNAAAQTYQGKVFSAIGLAFTLISTFYVFSDVLFGYGKQWVEKNFAEEASEDIIEVLRIIATKEFIVKLVLGIGIIVLVCRHYDFSPFINFSKRVFKSIKGFFKKK